jgi:carboxyl-terminal processing protease
MMEELIKAGEKEKIVKDEESLKVSGTIIARQIKGLVARDIYDTGAFYRIMIEEDKEVEKAVEILSDQNGFNRYLNK